MPKQLVLLLFLLGAANTGFAQASAAQQVEWRDTLRSPSSSHWLSPGRAEEIAAFGLFAATLAGIELSRRATPQDKAKHLGAGYLVGFAANGAYRLTIGRDRSWTSRLIGVGIGLAAAALVGAAKEYYDDESGSGTVERADFDYTVYGGVGGTLTIPIFEFLID